MSEIVILDPQEIALPDRTELNLNAGAIRVDEEGIDWGNAEIEAFMAQQQFGEAIIDYRLPNRVISMPMILGAVGDFTLARRALQAKVSRINEEGGSLKRVLNDNTYGFFDLVKATLKFGGSRYQTTADGFDPDAELVLEALPDFYGPKITLSNHEGTGDLVFTEEIKGNLPGRVDMTVTDLSGKNQSGLLWSFRCRNYSSASTALPTYEAEALTPLDNAAEVALTGASGGSTVRHNNLSTTWTPVLSTQLKGGGSHLTHKGLYDVYARVYTTSPTPPYLHLVYDVGDLTSPTENDPVQIPGANSFYIVHLGQINLRAAQFGAHRWQGVIQGYGSTGGQNVYIDRLWLQCSDESSGVMTGAQQSGIGLQAFKARDQFLQAEGPLTGLAAEVGGKTWAVMEGSDTTDFTVDAVAHRVKRTALQDVSSSAPQGRGVGLALGLTDQMAKIDFTQSAVLSSCYSGLVLRYANSTNYARVMVGSTGGSGGGHIVVEVMHVTLRVFQVGAIGEVKAGTLQVGIIGDELIIYLNGSRIQLGAENTRPGYGPSYPMSLMAPGGVYIWDTNETATPTTRTYDNYAVWVPPIDAVTYANRNTRIATQGIYRQDATGAAYGPVGYPNGDLPRVPVSGPEKRPVQVALKASRGNFGELTDSGLDKFSAQLAYWPCWSYVPEN
jgi:hypothetical protein